LSQLISPYLGEGRTVPNGKMTSSHLPTLCPSRTASSIPSIISCAVPSPPAMMRVSFVSSGHDTRISRPIRPASRTAVVWCKVDGMLRCSSSGITCFSMTGNLQLRQFEERTMRETEGAKKAERRKKSLTFGRLAMSSNRVDEDVNRFAREICRCHGAHTQLRRLRASEAASTDYSTCRAP